MRWCEFAAFFLHGRCWRANVMNIPYIPCANKGCEHHVSKRSVQELGATCGEFHQRVEHSVDLWKAFEHWVLLDASCSYACFVQTIDLGEKAQYGRQKCIENALAVGNFHFPVGLTCCRHFASSFWVKPRCCYMKATGHLRPMRHR